MHRPQRHAGLVSHEYILLPTSATSATLSTTHPGEAQPQPPIRDRVIAEINARVHSRAARYRQEPKLPDDHLAA